MSHRIVPVEPSEDMLKAAHDLPVTKTVDSMIVLAAIHGSRLTQGVEGNATPLQQWLNAAIAAAPPYVITDADVERAAIALLNARGFGFTNTPEDGQDLYDISCQALEMARAALEAFVKGLEG